MVARLTAYASIFIYVATPIFAKGPIDQLFPDKSGCYARSYSAEHLGSHPAQRVTEISLLPEGSIADPMLGLWVRVDLRGVPGGAFEALAYCEAAGAAQLSCGLEGDAGSFTITPAKDGAILIEVGRYGMSLENDTGFATLESQSGDDRSFLLRPASCR